MATRTTIDETIQFDATITERHSARVTLTKHPVEAGADPTDHAREEPESLQLDGIFTNTPCSELDRQARGARSGEPGVPGYALEQLNRLYRLKSSRRAVRVATAWPTYLDMVLTSVDLPRDASMGDAVRVSLTFEEVRFVSSTRVRLTLSARPSSVPRKPQEKVGQAKKTGTDAPELRRSFLKSVGDQFGVTTPGAGVL